MRPNCPSLLPRGIALFLALLPALWLPCVAAARSTDKDHPLVKRMPGAKMVGGSGSVRDLDQYWLALGKLTGDGQAEKYQVLEGKWTRFTYSNPQNRTVLEVYRSYKEKLLQAGFEIVYTCSDRECGEGGRTSNGDWWDANELRRYLAARLARSKGDVWVSLNVHAKAQGSPGQHDLDVVEVKPEPQAVKDETAPADPSLLRQALTENGHVAVYRITFDAGKLKPESEQMLKAIADLLARDPELKLHLVVHTDNAGSPAGSLQLSRRQASALVAELRRRYKIPAARIHAMGMGALAPLASNATEEGRAKNRRVELVPE